MPFLTSGFPSPALSNLHQKYVDFYQGINGIWMNNIHQAQALGDILDGSRGAARTAREQGNSFEHLIRDFLKNDPAYGPQFDGVWAYAEWTHDQGMDGRDVGIDLVASNVDGEGYTAVQCKFYDEHHRIQKSNIDSFFTASGKKPFTRGIIVDTTRGAWSAHAEAELNDPNHYVGYSRLGLSGLEASTIDWTRYSTSKDIMEGVMHGLCNAHQ